MKILITGGVHMLYFTSVYEVLLLLIYPLEALFFVFTTKKCFFEKLTIPKGLLIFLISPSNIQLASNSILYLMTDDNNLRDLLLYSAIKTIALVVGQLICLYLYIKIVKAKNSSIALFLYLCSAMLTPGSDIDQVILYPALPFFCTLVLLGLFYNLTVRPLSVIAQERQETDYRLFVIPPVIVFVYRTISLFCSMYRMGHTSAALSGAIQLSQSLREGNEEALLIFKEMFGHIRNNINIDPLMQYVSDLFIVLVLIVAFYVITKNISYASSEKKAHEETKTLAVEMMEALAHTIDAKDPYTKGHSVRVAKYSRMLAEKLGLSSKDCESVYYYGLLHDLGKIGIPNEIINSPSKLTPEQYNKIKEHPIIGNDILEEVHSRPDLTIGARWHHERYDGKGYPDGKKGEDIPMLARIIAVADAYDAMTSNRSYRSYMAQDKVRAEMVSGSGVQFDPAVAEKMIEIMDEDKEYALHE